MGGQIIPSGGEKRGLQHKSGNGMRISAE